MRYLRSSAALDPGGVDAAASFDCTQGAINIAGIPEETAPMVIVVVIIIIAVLLIAGPTAVFVRSSRSTLRTDFGPEYERAAAQFDTRREANRELLRRRRYHKVLALQVISAADQDSYAESWELLPGEFLDDPSHSLVIAERLVAQLIEARGYPGADPEEQMALLSVLHAHALADYRTARQTTRQAKADPASTSVGEMRHALLSYHALFDALLAVPGAAEIR